MSDYLVWWLVAGSIVLSLLLAILGLVTLGRGAQPARGLFTGSLGVAVLSFVLMVGYVVFFSGQPDEPTPAEQSGSQEPSALPSDGGAEPLDPTPTATPGDNTDTEVQPSE